jgi:hypothetical protein
MKKYLPIFPVLFLASCMPVPVEGEFLGCPRDDLREVLFYNGKPPYGSEISAATQSDGATTWVFENGDTYARCRYKTGDDRLQKLPQEMKSCTQKPLGGGIFCRSLI